VSQGIVLTIAAIDPHHTATLRADDGGQAFQMTAYASWKVGKKVECDLVDESRVAAQNCRLVVPHVASGFSAPASSAWCDCDAEYRTACPMV
jgi:hypothetical protein